MTRPHLEPPRAYPVARDPLTGALSRPFFFRMLEREVLEAEATGRAFALCLVDFDELCKINAAAGFRTGDAVLAGAAGAAREQLGETQWRAVPGVVARYDGDALLVLLRCARRDAVLAFATGLQQRIGALRWGGPPASVSAAVVVYEFGDSADALLARTERTLYVAKQFGPGHVEAAPAGGWERAAKALAAGG